MYIKKLQFHTNVYFATLYQLGVMMVFMQITRLIFFFFNQDMFSGISGNGILMAFLGGLRFDLTAVCYINIPFILMRILPFHFVYGKRYWCITNCIYGIFNSIGLLMNIADTPFYRFVNMRTQAVFISEIFQDGNTLDVLMGHLKHGWIYIPFVIIFIALFVWIATRVAPQPIRWVSDKRRIIVKIILFLFFTGLTVLGIRGNIQAGYPISVSDAVLYTSRNKDVNLVLNTPFSIIRTIGKDNTLPALVYYSSDECEKILPAVQLLSDSIPGMTGKNVVIIILEGTGSSFIRSINKYADSYPTTTEYSLTPFLDSLVSKSHVMLNAYANGRRSSAGITSVLGGFPALDPFVYMLSPYAQNEVDGVGTLLGQKGYSSVFFCGCNQGSYAFGAMSMAFGYNRFVDRVAYMKDKGDVDYDGSWGIFDDAMSRYMLNELNAMKPPFIASWFTLNTHGPFKIPDSYDGKFKSPKSTMENTVEYIDDVLHDFFADASREEWYHNTVFLITADHGSLVEGEDFYNSPNTLYKIPLIIYTPDGSIKPQIDYTVTSQIDVAPTILDILGYDNSFVALGSSVFDKNRLHYAVNMVNGYYQIIEDDYLLQFDGVKPVSLFNKEDDPMLTKNILASNSRQANVMTAHIKAFLQQYTSRITQNRMSINTTYRK